MASFASPIGHSLASASLEASGTSRAHTVPAHDTRASAEEGVSAADTGLIVRGGDAEGADEKALMMAMKARAGGAGESSAEGLVVRPGLCIVCLDCDVCPSQMSV